MIKYLSFIFCRLRSPSDDGGYFKPVSQVTVSLKEESSDDSTIISSQTSTLTRNQVPSSQIFKRSYNKDSYVIYACVLTEWENDLDLQNHANHKNPGELSQILHILIE